MKSLFVTVLSLALLAGCSTQSSNTAANDPAAKVTAGGEGACCSEKGEQVAGKECCSDGAAAKKACCGDAAGKAEAKAEAAKPSCCAGSQPAPK
jgi:hypothetical protein